MAHLHDVFVGIFIAFDIFGSKTRRMGLNLKAVTFPKLMGRRSNQGLYRAVLVGGPFIFMMIGVAFTAGALSNAYFYRTQNLISIAVAKGNTRYNP